MTMLPTFSNRLKCFVFFEDAETRSHFKRLPADGGPGQ